MSAEVLSVVGRVRGVHISETPAAGRYAAIRIARDPSAYLDFDAPEDWLRLRGRRVRLFFVEVEGSDGFTYRRIVDAEELP